MTDVDPEVGVIELIGSLDKYEAKLAREELFAAGKRYQTALIVFDLVRSVRSRTVSEVKKIAEENGISQFYRTSSSLKEIIENHLQKQLLGVESINSTLWHIQSLASVYWKKGFKEYAIKQIREGIDKLVLEDNPEHVLALLVEEQRMIRSANFDLREARHANYRSERNAALKIIENREAINDLSEEAFQLRRKYHTATHPEVLEKVQRIIDDPLLHNELGALSFGARIRFHAALSFCYSMLQDQKKAIYHHRAVVKAWEKRPDQQVLKPRTYQQAIINYLSECVKYGVPEDVEELYKQAEAIVIKDKAESATGFYYLSSFWLFYVMNNRPTEIGEEFARKVEDGISKHKDYLKESTLMVLRFNLADLMYLTDNLNEAIRLYTEVALKKTSKRKDLIGISKMMVMLLRFDRANSTYIESLNKEARRYFKMNPEVDTLNGLVYEFIGKMLSVVETEEESPIKMLQSRLEAIEKDKGDITGLEEVQVWLKSRLSGKTFGQVWQEQVASS